MTDLLFSKKRLQLSVLFALLFTITLSMVHFDSDCRELRQNVLRLHIIANSDSPRDQAVKLAVRDRILEETGEIFTGKTDLQAAQAAAEQNLPRFRQLAESVLRENGFSHHVTAEIGNSYFETREYEDFTLPAGTYRSLSIKIGKAEGKNWWCVVFPSICIPAASEACLSDSVEQSSAAIAENPQKYVMRFKTVEIYEDLKKFFTER